MVAFPLRTKFPIGSLPFVPVILMTNRLQGSCIFRQSTFWLLPRCMPCSSDETERLKKKFQAFINKQQTSMFHPLYQLFGHSGGRDVWIQVRLYVSQWRKKQRSPVTNSIGTWSIGQTLHEHAMRIPSKHAGTKYASFWYQLKYQLSWIMYQWSVQNRYKPAH